jgi:hypothetical protein
VRTELDPTQATAFGIADNRTAELAEWDEDVLVSLLDSLDAETRDLMHFDEKELEAMVPKATVEVVEDEVPEEVEPRTKPGDLWLLGRHRLLCGDSTKAEDVARLMDGEACRCLSRPILRTGSATSIRIILTLKAMSTLNFATSGFEKVFALRVVRSSPLDGSTLSFGCLERSVRATCLVR